MADGSVKIDVELTKNKFESALKSLEASAKSGATKIGTVFESAGKKLSDIFNMPADRLKGFGMTLSATGSKLTTYITKPALAAGAALAGITIAKGFTRLKNIDLAKAQLEGLGHSAKTVTEIMDNAMESVKGTAYSFDEAATAAASAVAAGIEPGKELTRYLGLIGDAASQSKISFTEMGSIFNKIMASGKISMEEVNQLADQGIPIYKMLSDQLGVTQADIRDMVSEGKVGSKEFLDAVDSYIGGAAKIIGEKSFTGALANIGASIGRIGANFLDAGGKGGGFFSQLKPLMVDFMDTLAVLEDKASSWGETFGKAFSNIVSIIKAIPAPLLGIGTALAVSAGPALKLAGNILQTAGAIKIFKAESAGMGIAAGIANGKLTVMQGIMLKMGGIVKTAATSLVTFVTSTNLAATATSALSKAFSLMTANKFILIGAAVVALGTALFAASQKAGGFSELFSSIGSKVQTVFSNITGIITEFASAFATQAPQIFQSLLTALSKGIPQATQAGVDALLGFIKGINSSLPQIIKSGTQIITEFIEGITSSMPAIIEAAVTLIEGLIQGFADNAGLLVELAAQLILGLIDGIVSNAELIIGAAVQLVTALVQGLVQAIPILVQAMPQIITALIQGLIQALPLLISAAGQIILTIIQGIAQALPQLVAAAPKIIQSVITGALAVIASLIQVGTKIIQQIKNAIINKLSQIASAGRDVVTKLKSAIIGKLQDAYDAGTKLVNKVKDAIKKKIDDFKQIGKDIVSGLINGFADKAEALKTKASQLASSIKEKLKNAFNVKSPSRWMRDYLAKNIMQGWANGLEKYVKLVNRSMDNVTSTVKGKAMTFSSRSIGAFGGGSNSNTTIDNRTINQNFYNKQTTPYEAYKKAVRGFAY